MSYLTNHKPLVKNMDESESKFEVFIIDHDFSKICVSILILSETTSSLSLKSTYSVESTYYEPKFSPILNKPTPSPSLESISCNSHESTLSHISIPPLSFVLLESVPSTPIILHQRKIILICSRNKFNRLSLS